MEPADLNAVLLVGGSSRIPLVAQMIAAALDRPILVDAHPKYAVALGAATLAAELAAPSTHGEAPLRPAAPAEFVGPPVSAAASRASWVGGDTPRSTPATDPFAGAGKSAHPDAAAPTAPPIAEPSPEQPYASELLPQAPSVDLSESWTPDTGHAVGRPPAAAPRGDDVQFTVYRPAQIAPLEWCPLLVYAHQSAPFLEPETGRMIDPEREVVTDAGRELPQGRPYRRSITDSADSIPPLGELLLQPWLSEGFVDPPHQELEWHGSTQRADFQICAPANPTSARISGGVRFFLGPVIVGEAKFRIDITAGGTLTEENMRSDEVKRYRRIFVSYSHQDYDIVQAVRDYNLTGDEYLIDLISLHPGANWKSELTQLIDQSDIFQLFWSRNAMSSPHVRREWEHALGLQRPGFVCPVYWEDPRPVDRSRQLPPPPWRNCTGRNFHRPASPAVDRQRMHRCRHPPKTQLHHRSSI